VHFSPYSRVLFWLAERVGESTHPPLLLTNPLVLLLSISSFDGAAVLFGLLLGGLLVNFVFALVISICFVL